MLKRLVLIKGRQFKCSKTEVHVAFVRGSLLIASGNELDL